MSHLSRIKNPDLLYPSVVAALRACVLRPASLDVLVSLGICNRLPALLRHGIAAWKAPRQSTPPYILVTDHCSHFSYLLPLDSLTDSVKYPFRLIISTFFLYIQRLQSYIHNQVAHAIPHTAKLTVMSPAHTTCCTNC